MATPSTTITWIDLETGGLDDDSPIIQIAAVASVDGREVNHLERKISFDERDASREALDLNSYDRGIWADESVPIGTALSELMSFLRSHADTVMVSKRGKAYKTATIGGHNVASFDIPRLRSAAGSVYIPACWWYPLDTYQGAIWFFHGRDDKPDNYRLETLAEYFGINVDGAHDALNDARLCMHLYRELTTKD